MFEDSYFAIIAGICASSAGLFGKLSGLAYDSIGIVGSGISLVIMVLLNAAMWTFFSKSLKYSSTSIGPTVVSSATNYLLSGIIGVLIFDEKTSIIWWSGTSLVLIGLFLITRGNTKSHQP